MERDNDFLRELLFEIEKEEHGFRFVLTMGDSDEDHKKSHHLELLYDKEYVCQRSPHVYRLTSDGHDFIEAIRDDGIWKKTKDAVAKKGGPVALDFIKTIAMGFLKGE